VFIDIILAIYCPALDIAIGRPLIEMLASKTELCDAIISFALLFELFANGDSMLTIRLLTIRSWQGLVSLCSVLLLLLSGLQSCFHTNL